MARRQLGVLPSRTRDLAEYGTGSGSGAQGVYYSTSYVDASLGNSNGSQSFQNVGAGFTTITLNTINSDPGGRFNTTSSLYTVLASGLYLALAKVRLLDGTAGFNFGLGVHTDNVDHPSFVWNSVVNATGGVNRKVLDYQRMAFFNAGDQPRLYAYSDGATASINTAQLTIVRIA